MAKTASTDALLRSHLDYIAADEARRAAHLLIGYIDAQSGVTGEANLHGVIRAYKYMVGRDNPLAFIFNQESLLFYVRNPALRLSAVAALADSWIPGKGLAAKRNPAGELTVKVTTEAQARFINATLVRPLLKIYGVNASLPEKDDSVPEELVSGPVHQFSEWPNVTVPRVAAGVYTIWRGGEFIYVGMAGRSLTSTQIEEERADRAARRGLVSRLHSHASGRRSGDQFCVYVADRLVLPTLDRKQIMAIAAGSLKLDRLVRDFIHDQLTYRFAVADDAVSAFAWEKALRHGCRGVPAPLLNPGNRPKGSQSDIRE